MTSKIYFLINKLVQCKCTIIQGDTIRVCIICTSAKVLVLVLGVEPESNLMVVQYQLGSDNLVWVGHRDANRTLGRTRAILVQPGSGSIFGSVWSSTLTSVYPN